VSNGTMRYVAIFGGLLAILFGLLLIPQLGLLQAQGTGVGNGIGGVFDSVSTLAVLVFGAFVGVGTVLAIASGMLHR
jgi:hypothetical protein